MATKMNDTKCIFVIMLIAALALVPPVAQTGWAGSGFSRGKAHSGKSSGFQNRGATTFRAAGRSSTPPTQMGAGARSRFSSPPRNATTVKSPQRSFNRKPAVISRGSAPRVPSRNNNVITQRSNRAKTSSRFTASKRTVEIPRFRTSRSKHSAGNTRSKTVTTTNATRSPNRTGVAPHTNKGSSRITSPKPLARKTIAGNALTPAGRKGSASRVGNTSTNRRVYKNDRSGSARSRSSAVYGISKRDRERYEGGTPGSHNSGRGAYGRYERPHIKRGEHHGYQRFGYYPSRIFYPVVWSSYYYPVYYDFGPYSTFRYVYPYYHRKYVFVSLGGYWPIDYGYLRYYRYGCHPYDWYGYYPLAYEGGSDADSYYTYNTYNYYDDDASEPSSVYQENSEAGETPVEDSNDLRTELPEEPAKEPQEETLADRYFEKGVAAFEGGDYDLAASSFEDATRLEPEDMVLPFAYVQALLADQQYEKAAETLRSAVKELPPDQAGVFFPRGLYSDDEILFGHIDRLATQSKLNPYNSDLQLLLGYQFLGVGKYDQAEEPLRKASLDHASKPSSQVMLSLLEKLKE